MTRKGSQPLERRQTICYTRGYKNYKVSLTMWELFRERTNIDVPTVPPPVRFGAGTETKDIPPTTLPWAILDILRQAHLLTAQSVPTLLLRPTPENQQSTSSRRMRRSYPTVALQLGSLSLPVEEAKRTRIETPPDCRVDNGEINKFVSRPGSTPTEYTVWRES